jgi:Tetratricopeptide repeat
VTGHDDLMAVLPEPPLPAAKPRDTAIAAALARFDGAPASARTRGPEPTPWCKTLQWPQAGLIAATALVVAISLPFTWQPPIPPVPTTDEGIVSRTNSAAPSGGQELTEAPVAIPAVKPRAAQAGAVGIDPVPSQPDTAAPVPPPMAIAHAAPAAPPALLDMREEKSAPILAQRRALSLSLQGTPVAVSAASPEEIFRDESSIVVTGSHISSNKPVGRGDWNACTVNDPGRALARCQKLARKAPKAIRSQAEIHLSDGLKHAWNGELDKAVAAFDAGIAIAPDLSAAYLNRGLVYGWQGNSEAAIADLNRAVQLSPKSARAYYNRSVLLRKYGNSKRADADEQQAINLNPRYHAVIR